MSAGTIARPALAIDDAYVDALHRVYEQSPSTYGSRVTSTSRTYALQRRALLSLAGSRVHDPEVPSEAVARRFGFASAEEAASTTLQAPTPVSARPDAQEADKRSCVS